MESEKPSSSSASSSSSPAPPSSLQFFRGLSPEVALTHMENLSFADQASLMQALAESNDEGDRRLSALAWPGFMAKISPMKIYYAMISRKWVGQPPEGRSNLSSYEAEVSESDNNSAWLFNVGSVVARTENEAKSAVASVIFELMPKAFQTEAVLDELTRTIGAEALDLKNIWSEGEARLEGDADTARMASDEGGIIENSFTLREFANTVIPAPALL